MLVRPLLLIAMQALLAGQAPAAESTGVLPMTSASSDTRATVNVPSTLIIRVNAATLVPALDAQVFEERQGGELKGLMLGFNLDRAELVKLRPPSFDMQVDGVTLLSFDPERPVRVLAKARPELVKDIASRLTKGQILESLVATPDSAGFPMLFDLENYTFYGVIQDQGGQK